MPEGFPNAEESPSFPVLATAVELLGAFGMTMCLTVFFFAMRGVMDLGGFVARGGPYEIAHPAPDWVWVAPVSIWIGLLSGAVQVAAAEMAGGFSLMFFGWTATFLGGAWNFFEYGFRPPGGGGLAWGWIVCGVAFVGLGLPGVFGMVNEVSAEKASPFGVSAMFSWFIKARPKFDAGRRAVYGVANLAAIAAGVIAGWRFFATLAG